MEHPNGAKADLNPPSAMLNRVRHAIDRSRDFHLRIFRTCDAEDRPVRASTGFQDVPPSKPIVGGTIVGGQPGTEERGYWNEELEADTSLESDYILFLYFLDPVANEDKIRRLANYIRSKQLPEGGWNIYYGGPAEVSASVKGYFALKLAGVPIDDPGMQRARDAIIAMGGAEKVNSFTKIYLSFLNQVDWSACPAIPPEIVLLPRFFYFNIYEISYWSRAILVPLSILYARKPNRRVPEGLSIREIFAATHRGNGNGSIGNGNDNGHSAEGGADDGVKHGNAGGAGDGHRIQNGHGESNGAANGNVSLGRADEPFSLTIPRDPNLFTWKNFFLLVDRILKLLEKAPVKPLRGLALKTAERWMLSRIEKSDGLGAIFPAVVNSVMAMHSLGYDESHPHVAHSLDKLRRLEIEDGNAIRLQPCQSPVWDTALAISALHEAGVASGDPAIVAAARWLVGKEVRSSGDWKVRNRDDVEVSGWYFQFQNEFYPDVDDTAAVLMALERADLSSVQGGADSIRRGIAWVLSMQCSNGGWASFDVDVDREIFTKFPFADHNAMLDPACADITGRVLEMLGRFASLRDHADVRRAVARRVEFLRQSQDPGGAWYGRWGVNYIYGTWQALKGLTAVGEDPNGPYIRKAVEWLRSRQNGDGGWGESCRSYDEAAEKGNGTSTPSQTAWAVMGLIAAGEAGSAEVQRGIEFLLERQRADGSWEEQEFTGTGFPCVFYLRYHMYRLYFPLFALGMYERALKGSGASLSDKDVDLPLRPDRPGQGGRTATSMARQALRGIFGR